MTPAEVIALLPTPEILMRKVNLRIAGRATPAPAATGTQAAIVTCKVAMKGYVGNNGFVQTMARGFTTGTSGLLGRQKDRPIAEIEILGGVAAVTPGADQFNAFYIPMVQAADAPNASHYALPETTGPDIVITSQLSGCTFGVGSDAAGVLLVTHVQPAVAVPTGAPPGTTPAAYLRQQVRAGFGTLRGLASRAGSYSEYAAIIGVRDRARANRKRIWRFYLQAYGTSTGTDVVTGVTRI